MAKQTKNPELPQPELLITRKDAEAQIIERIEKGKGILNTPITNAEQLDAARNQRKIWHEYNEELLSRIFSNEKISKDYTSKSTPAFFSLGSEGFYQDIEDFRESVQRKLTNLESLLERIQLFPEPVGMQKKEQGSEAELKSLGLLHPIIKKECVGLVDAEYYGEAVEKSFKIVRDKLRTLTGYETTSEAFGKGHLFVKGAAASNVEADFQSAIKFLGMSIDYFRNEKAHTTTANITDRAKALQYLVLSSIALQHLENGEIRSS